ncbi:putative bifunctional diguanylate cyclase/phosphodiesterase [Arsenicicoccus dermatophilus]|uniref:putative bifunctional diguanylate cyclase/phosphodiesterase n=1 Tax=Arsenicicoccus dermatophilus TaxID=1076331 RepID=UPI001F4C5594|nr:EAL domain-containing protein [Arsenicicoccus dermatophilus]
MSGTVAWLASGLLLLALGVLLRARVQVRRAPVATVGLVLLGVGSLGADVARTWLHEPMAALVLLQVATLGLCLSAYGLFRSWTEILAEGWMLAGGVTLVANFALQLSGRHSDSLQSEADLVQLALVGYLPAVVLLVGHQVFARRRALRLLVCAVVTARAISWALIFLATSVPAPALGRWAGVPTVLAHLGLLALPFVDRPRRWVPERDTGLYAAARLPYVVTAIVVTTAVVTRAAAPRVPRASVLVVGGGFVIALLARQLVANTRLREAMQESRERERYFRTLVQDSQDVVLICDATGRLDYVSPAAERVIRTPGAGRGPGDPGMRTLHELLGADPRLVREALAVADRTGRSRLDVHHGGQVLEGNVGRREDGYVVAVRDVTERDGLRERLRALAFNDVLTGLPNRQQLVQELTARLAAGGRTVVLYLDLDRFKQVNDSDGHHAGDALLQQVSVRIGQAVRGEQGTEPLVARLGGDEFVVVLRGGVQEGTRTAHRVHAAIVPPFVVGERVHQVGASVGLAVGAPGVDAEELLRRADLAMYAAKQSTSVVRLYEPGLSLAAQRRADQDSELSRQWRQDAVQMHLQPIVTTDDLQVRSVEALLRWAADGGAVTGPGRVLDYAARTGQLARLTGWTVDAAIRTLQTLGPRTVPVAVNVPTVLLHSPGPARGLLRHLQAHDVRPEQLHLELTEEAMVERGPEVTRTLQTLRAQGFRVYIDDFGTGYSSLSYLVHLPVDGIKIDRAFVRDLPSSSAARSIVTGVVTFARELGITLVAEGVETAAEARWVRELGVPLAQGYWYARPQDAALLRGLDELVGWGDALGEGGAAPRAAAPFALGRTEC